MHMFKVPSRKTLLKETLSIIKTYHIKPKKKLSQNFIIDPNLLYEILNEVSKVSPKKILEIGGGIGTLSLFLADIAETLVIVEIDKRLIKVLKERVGGKNVKIVMGDFLRVYRELGEFDVVVSNVPYHISSKILFTLAKITFKKAVLTLQKEFADRLFAKPNDPNYSRLTVMSNLFFNIENLGSYPPSSFYPSPKVYSTLIILNRKKAKLEVPLEFFEKLIRIFFSSKNKMLRVVLRNIKDKNMLNVNLDKASIILNPYLNRRIKSFTLGELIEIAEILYGNI